MGSGYRTFTAGEILTASNVQNFLQDQAVMVFAGTAARSSAIGTANFEEGMLTYLTDVDKLQVYTGATFADVYPPAASNQGLTLLQSVTFSGVSSQSVNSVFSATYQNYKIVVNATTSATPTLSIRWRVGGVDNSTAGSYGVQYIFATGATTSTANESGAQAIFGSSGSSTQSGNSYLEVSNPFNAVPTAFMSQTQESNSAVVLRYSYHNQSTSYDGFTITPSTGTMTGTVRVYGYSN
jgi:hypothetical protein